MEDAHHILYQLTSPVEQLTPKVSGLKPGIWFLTLLWISQAVLFWAGVGLLRSLSTLKSEVIIATIDWYLPFLR